MYGLVCSLDIVPQRRVGAHTLCSGYGFIQARINGQLRPTQPLIAFHAA
jgi:hypothetical protein